MQSTQPTPKKGKELSGYEQLDNLKIVFWTGYLSTLVKAHPLTSNWKAHISIDQTDDKYTRACEKVTDILTREKIHHFKVLWQSTGSENSNLQGKEIVIYMQKNSSGDSLPAPEYDAAFWIKVFSEIETELEKIGIKPSQHEMSHRGDKIFAGSRGYISHRDGYNMLGVYVEANALIWAGFTAEEAYRIGGDTLFSEWFAGKQLHSDEKESKAIPNISTITLQEEKLSTEKLKAPNNLILLGDITLKIFESYVNDLNETNDEMFPFAGREVFLGDVSKTQSDLSEEQIYFSCLFHLTPPNNRAETIQKRYEKNCGQDIELFGDALSRAAQLTSIILMNLAGTKLPEIPKVFPGNITPIVYYQLFKPYIEEANKTKQRPDLNSIIKKHKLVEHIVKASFRTRTVGEGEEFSSAQIFFDKPQYAFDLTDKQLDQLISAAFLVEANLSPEAGAEPVQVSLSGRDSPSMFSGKKVVKEKSEPKPVKTKDSDPPTP